MNHPSPTLGYKIESQGVSVLYLSDHEPFAENVWRYGAPPGRMESILEAGDRRHAEYMKDADLFGSRGAVHAGRVRDQAQLGPQHLLYVVELAAAAGVRRLFLNASRSLA